MRFIKLDPNSKAALPVRATDGSAGYDFEALNAGCLVAGGRILIKTGITLDPNYARDDECLQLFARSGHANKFGLILLAGLIDSDYRHDIGVILYNSGNDVFFWEAGERIAQGVIMPIKKADHEVDPTLVRDGGFGSTGVASLN